jgi:GxxExxY protein
MPIQCDLSIPCLSDDEFEVIDKAVMTCAYAAQNKLGRLCEERVYENDLAARLRSLGFGDVHTQVGVAVSFRDFTKVYRLDLVVQGMVYELKAVDALASNHDAQVFHYAALLNMDRIKLLNFGGPHIQGRLRRCPFGTLDRMRVNVDRSRWAPLSKRCEMLAADAEACLHEWGGFLDTRLFEEALIAFNGGELGCVQRLPVVRNGLALGHHRTALHAEEVGFVVTAMGNDTAGHEEQLRALLGVLPVRGWQWINVHHDQMRLVTVRKTD